MRFTTKALACASALALTAPALAQEDQMEAPDAATWQEVTTPSYRFIQRGADGTVLFDSGSAAEAAEAAPGASDPELAEQIAEADGATPGATDVREMGGDEMVTVRRGPWSSGTSGDTDLAATFDDPSAAPATDGQYGQSASAGNMTSPSGMEFDMDEFAREMFEQGYRRGYVSGLTEMRTRAVRQMQGERAEFARDRARFELQARQQEAAMRNVLDGARMERRQDGSTVIMLPPGVTPQQFMRSLNR